MDSSTKPTHTTIKSKSTITSRQQGLIRKVIQGRQEEPTTTTTTADTTMTNAESNVPQVAPEVKKPKPTTAPRKRALSPTGEDSDPEANTARPPPTILLVNPAKVTTNESRHIVKKIEDKSVTNTEAPARKRRLQLTGTPQQVATMQADLEEAKVKAAATGIRPRRQLRLTRPPGESGVDVATIRRRPASSLVIARPSQIPVPTVRRANSLSSNEEELQNGPGYQVTCQTGKPLRQVEYPNKSDKTDKKPKVDTGREEDEEEEEEEEEEEVEESEEEEDEDPGKGPKPSTTLLIRDIVPPYRINALKEVLGPKGGLLSYCVSQDRTSCMAEFDTIQSAISAHRRLHGLQWPPKNGGRLRLTFTQPLKLQVKKASNPTPAESTSLEERFNRTKCKPRLYYQPNSPEVTEAHRQLAYSVLRQAEKQKK